MDPVALKAFKASMAIRAVLVQQAQVAHKVALGHLSPVHLVDPATPA